MKPSRIPVFLLLLFALFSCDTMSQREIVTGDATVLSCRLASLSGRTSIHKKMTCGVVYSKDSKMKDDCVLKTAGIIDSEGQFSIETDDLQPETNYYYKCYQAIKDTIWGEIKNFTTTPINTVLRTNAPTNITFHAARFSAAYEYDIYVIKDKISEYGFVLTSQDGLIQRVIADKITGNSYAASAKTLMPATQYDVQAYVILDGKTYLAEKITFETEGIGADITLNTITALHSKATISGRINIDNIDENINRIRANIFFCDNTTAPTQDALESMGNRYSKSISLSPTGDFLIEISNLNPITQYSFSVIASIRSTEKPYDYYRVDTGLKVFTTQEHPVPEAVEMGLSVKWASFNIGASTPEEGGNYYAWGEIATQIGLLGLRSGYYYIWGTYSFGNGREGGLIKYREDDNKTVLEKDDDVASQILGGSWRIPTEQEWLELTDTKNCLWTRATQYGVNGYVVTSKLTGRRIFLPVHMGIRRGRKDNKEADIVYYWSSSIWTPYSSPDYNMGSCLEFCWDWDVYELTPEERCMAYPVRAVCD